MESLEPNMTEPKRILILTEEMGLGHLSASRAVSSALNELYGEQCVVKIADLKDEQRSKAASRRSQDAYDRMVRENPGLYKLGYELSDLPISTTLVGGAMTMLMLNALNNLVKRFQPDVIVATRQTFLPPLSGLFTLNGLFTLRKRRIPVITIVTDLTTVHHMWFDPVSDYVLVPTRVAHKLAVQSGLSKDKVKITGVPINPDYARETRPREELRATLDWRPDLPTLLVVGGTRVRRLRDVLHALNHSGLPLQLAIVAGGDNAFYESLQRIEWHMTTHLYGFVDTLPQMMRAADCIACKAGGLIVSESLACGLPILIIDRIEGQETGNVDYVVDQGAGELALTSVDALEVMFHWLDNDRKLLRVRAENARQAGRLRSAYDAAEIIWTACGGAAES